MSLWKVDVSRSARCEYETITYIVEADTSEEAKRLAMGAPRHNPLYRWLAGEPELIEFVDGVAQVGYDYYER